MLRIGNQYRHHLTNNNRDMKEGIKKIGWDAYKIAGQLESECISGSKFRELIRTSVAQFVIDEILPVIPKSNHKKVINEMGFFHEAECARQMGVSKQYLNRMTKHFDEKITYEGKLYYMPLPINQTP